MALAVGVEWECVGVAATDAGQTGTGVGGPRVAWVATWVVVATWLVVVETRVPLSLSWVVCWTSGASLICSATNGAAICCLWNGSWVAMSDLAMSDLLLMNWGLGSNKRRFRDLNSATQGRGCCESA